MNNSILSVENIRESEGFTMQNEPITSIELMERAGQAFVNELEQATDLEAFSEIFVFCGPGNNGGDGLAIARLLAVKGYRTNVVLCLASNSHTSNEFNLNLKRWEELSFKTSNTSTLSFEENTLISFPVDSLIIDALFGIGLSRPLTDIFAKTVTSINHSEQYVIAVDVPSGLYLDEHTPQNNTVIRAHRTFTFQFYKLAYLLPETYSYTGEISILDIGLQLPPESANFTPYHLIRRELLLPFLHPINQYAHKGTQGHGLLIAGSVNMPGAAFLSAIGALRGGIGKVTVHTPAKVAQFLPVAIPEAILSIDKDEQHFSFIDLEKHSSTSAIAVGPGLGTHQATAGALKNLLDEIQSPIILDADALNILAESKTWLTYLPKYSILTPHIKEFERLSGKSEHDFDRLRKVKAFATQYEVIVILKGAHSVIAMPDGKLFFNTTGNAGMATAGSGDVLTGLLLALLAGGYPPPIAALLAPFIHGLAGDIALTKGESVESLIASDLTFYFGEAFRTLRPSTITHKKS
ncbi:MAG: NAD(P)H-hydrate dehydratase [Bacteroidales bacterium]